MTTFNTSREIPAAPDLVFAAIRNPQRLARWWGPAGFTNTITGFDFTPGGRWSLTMHGPNGANYPNELVFAVIDAPGRVAMQHVSEPKFLLIITLAATAAGTLVSWAQTFESAEVAARLEAIVVPANDQNLERLAAEVLQPPSVG